MDLRSLDDTDGAPLRPGVLAAVFAATMALAGLDLIVDLREGTTLRHALVEGSIVLAGAIGLGVVLLHLLGTRRVLAERLVQARADAERWQAETTELMHGFGAAIDRQLARWELTPAEREVALFLLKGLSHKAIADVRGVSEATVRQQARGVYQKAGVEGRHDLAAFFLTGLPIA